MFAAKPTLIERGTHEAVVVKGCYRSQQYRFK